jgi:hypothetical protein
MPSSFLYIDNVFDMALGQNMRQERGMVKEAKGTPAMIATLNAFESVCRDNDSPASALMSITCR